MTAEIPADAHQPQTPAGAQAAADKAAAAAKLAAAQTNSQSPAATAAADQAAAEAAAERKREQTAAARQARAEARARTAAAEPELDAAAPVQPAGCDECRASQEALMLRLGALERQVGAIGKLVGTAVVAGVVIYLLSGIRADRAQAAEAEEIAA